MKEEGLSPKKNLKDEISLSNSTYTPQLQLEGDRHTQYKAAGHTITYRNDPQ